MGRRSCGRPGRLMTEYLADTSAWTNVRKSPAAWEYWVSCMRADQIRGTTAVLIELLRGTRSRAEFRMYRTAYAALRPLIVDEAVWSRALDVQEQLVERGAVRGVALADLVVAAAAERSDVLVLHYDKDFDLIADITGQPTQWIAPRGSL